MFLAAADALADAVTEEDRANGSVLPALERLRELSVRVAEDVVRLTLREGTAGASIADPAAAVRAAQHQAEYPRYA